MRRKPSIGHRGTARVERFVGGPFRGQEARLCMQTQSTLVFRVRGFVGKYVRNQCGVLEWEQQ